VEKVDLVREEALKIVSKVFENKAFSNILIKNMGEKFSPLDRAFITEMVYGTIKWKLKIDNIINNFSRVKSDKISPFILNILRLGIYQLDYMDKVPESAAVNESVKLAKKYGNPGAAKYVNAVLRNYIRKQNEDFLPDKNEDSVKYLSMCYSYPEWIVEKLVDEYGNDFTESFLDCSNKVPGLNIRVNRLKTQKEILTESLTKKGIEVKDGIYLGDALLLKDVPGIENLDEYKNGYLTVQDESSMLAVCILSPKPGELIMDVCSAPGTKTTYIAELMDNKGKILAGDINESKLRLVEQNVKRLGINIVETYCQDAALVLDEYRDKADRVIVDAPCSGLGIMRKKPEIRWNRSNKDIKQIQSIQGSILEASSNYVKVGGVLLYSTCTIIKEENEMTIHKFLEDNKNFVLEDICDFLPEGIKKESCKDGYIELYPNIDGVDGFFIARLRRVN